MKTMTCRPAEEIMLNIEGGDSVLLRFDVNAVMNLQEYPGGFQELMKLPLPELAAYLIYAAAKSKDNEFGLEKARTMVSCMSVMDVQMIIEEFSSSMGTMKNEEQKELSKNLMAQFLSTLK